MPITSVPYGSLADGTAIEEYSLTNGNITVGDHHRQCSFAKPFETLRPLWP